MTIQTLGLGKTAYPDLSYAPAPSRALTKLSVSSICKKLVVFHPPSASIIDLVAKAGEKMGRLASLETVKKVVSHNPDNLWAIARKSRYDWNAPQIEGFVALLHLNTRGEEALFDGTLDGLDPDLSLLTAQNEKPAAIYVWALYAPGVLAAGVPLVLEKASSPLYQDATLYARAVTTDGRQFMESLGWRLGARLGERFDAELFIYPRGEDHPANRPAYDSWRPGEGRAAITVARNLDDFNKAMSIRSAVYISEQECPYEEEFDGNDFSATHLIGYVGDEPAATLRLRFYADFAKLERVAVRHEFRSTRISFDLIRAAIELSRVKGYRRLYGHARKRLTAFWTRFGFRTFEGGSELVFSDHDYVEMVLEMDRHPEAIALGGDPYRIIRPEGRWHLPSVLEKSASRPLTRPARNMPSSKNKVPA